MTLLCIILLLFTICDLLECDWATMPRRQALIELALTAVTIFACGWGIAYDLFA
jgi:hypothetical protein